MFTESFQDGRYSLECTVTETGNGINVFIGGGEAPHIGSVAVSQPHLSLKNDGSISCTTSVINLPAHKDHHISVPFAESLCRELNTTVVVTAGVHIDAAAPEELARILKNTELLKENILDRLKRTAEERACSVNNYR